MSALTSLLVRDRVVPVSKIEEALQTQVVLGGDIEVILLEMNALPEDVLSAYRAALFDLLPATREEVMHCSREALRRIPPHVARSLGIVPIYYEGHSLVVAAWKPPPEEQARELEARLDCEMSVRIVNQVRLASALSQHYGFELDVRLRRLSDAMRRRDPGIVPYVRPPSPSMPPIPPFIDVAAEPVFEPASESDGQEPDEGLGPEELREEAFDRSKPAPAGDELEQTSAPVTGATFEQGPDGQQLVSESTRGDESRSAAASSSPVDEPAGKEGNLKDVSMPPGVSPRLFEATRQPLELARAIELLGEVAQRDDVLFVLLRYVAQFFDFVCLFSVGREGARARMVHGAELDHEQLAQALVLASESGLFATALREGRPMLGSWGAAEAERAAHALLGRPEAALALLVPLELNGRSVLAVHVERADGELGIEHASIVQALVPAVLAALRRVILDSKAQRRASIEPPAPLPTEPADEAPPSAAPASKSREDSSSGVPALSREDSSSGVPALSREDSSSGVPALSAIDLDAYERLAGEQAGRFVPARVQPRDPAARPSTLVRERIAGVPRSAPPPPQELPVAASPAAVGYRQRGVPAVASEPGRSAESTSLVSTRPALVAGELAEESRRHRLSLVEPEAVPSVIIDMGDSIEQLVESLEAAAPGSEPPEVEELLSIGESALPVLMQRFPGPLWFDRARPHKRRPRGRDVSAIARAMAAFGDRAAPYLASLLMSGDSDTSFYALLVAGELIHPELIDPVARRVLDRDEATRALALEVLRSHAVLPQYDIVLRALSDMAERPGTDRQKQRLAVEALGELRDSRALPVLIARLSDSDEQVVRAAHRALLVLTGQDFGSNVRRWSAWADGWRRAHRVEWLIEALLHSDENIRSLAGEELKLLTQQYFGYHPALPKRDREVAQRKYREWWELEGRLAFER